MNRRLEDSDEKEPKLTMLAAFSFCLATTLAAADTPKTAGPHWEIAGDLSEACTCAVPCTCNFGGSPSPKHYCWAMFAVDIQKGHYGDLDLAGLHLAGAHGKKGAVWYIDNHASPQQAAALKTIAAHLLRDPAFPVHYETAAIVQQVGDKSNRLAVAGKGEFEADYIIGFDGKTPVIVENNSSWNIQHGIKARTKRLRYRDEFGNKFNLANTNSNQGKFDWTDQTPKYF